MFSLFGWCFRNSATISQGFYDKSTKPTFSYCDSLLSKHLQFIEVKNNPTQLFSLASPNSFV